MQTVDSNTVINQIISSFYRIGFWHKGNEATAIETGLKLFYCFYYSLFLMSLIPGSFNFMFVTYDELMVLFAVAVAVSIQLFSLCFLILKQNQILEMFHQIRVYAIESQDGFFLVTGKLKRFIRNANILISLILIAAIYCSVLVPIYSRERKLLFNIDFPFVYWEEDSAYWVANIFIFTEICLTINIFMFSILICYLTLNCALRYEVLGFQIQKIGQNETTEFVSNLYRTDWDNQENHEMFHRDLTLAIESHQQIRK